MSPPSARLTDEIMLVLEINRAKFDALEFGEIVFKVHQGKLKEVGALETLRLDTGIQLPPLSLHGKVEKG